MNLNTCLGVLDDHKVEYAFYYRRGINDVVFKSNCDIFRAASLIKIPILLSWIALEKTGLVNRNEICDLDSEPQVQGAGFSYLLKQRQLPYHDILLMMMATSDNLCTNLVINRIGLSTLQQTMRETFLLEGSRCERRLMDYDARNRGLDNWVSASEYIKLFDLVRSLDHDNLLWVKTLLNANTDDALLKRNIPRDSVNFYHKTGSISGVLHDWGFTDHCDIFLLTQSVSNEPPVFEVFGTLGEFML